MILCDNTSAISISKNLVMHSKTKHIPIKFHFLQEQVTEKNIKLEYIGTKEQAADVFTKPLPRETFEYLRQKLGVIPSPHWSMLLMATECDRGSCDLELCDNGDPLCHWSQRGRNDGRRGSLVLGGSWIVVINDKGGDWWLGCHWWHQGTCVIMLDVQMYRRSLKDHEKSPLNFDVNLQANPKWHGTSTWRGLFLLKLEVDKKGSSSNLFERLVKSP